jgi:ketosteroid isomerase-like protein
MAANTETQTEASKQTVLNYLEVFSKGNVSEILDAMTDDATWWVAGTLEGISGTKDREGFGQMLGGISETCKGPITLTPTGVTAEGDKVAVEAKSYAEVKNGRVYDNEYHFLFTVRDGKISSVKEYLDTEHTRAIFLAP